MLTRLEQINALHECHTTDMPVLIHGSIAHHSMMGVPLPSVRRTNGDVRDIDIYSRTTDSDGLGDYVAAQNVDQPSKIDSALSDVLVKVDDDYIDIEHTLEVELPGAVELLEDYRSYEVVGSDGVMVKTFSPEGILLIHRLKMIRYRARHPIRDHRLICWFEDNGVVLPEILEKALIDKRKRYVESHPLGLITMQFSGLYSSVLPQRIKDPLRPTLIGFKNRLAK